MARFGVLPCTSGVAGGMHACFAIHAQQGLGRGLAQRDVPAHPAWRAVVQLARVDRPTSASTLGRAGHSSPEEIDCGIATPHEELWVGAR
eukprot:5232478-Lingulodinium_polyedra.AAC.1